LAPEFGEPRLPGVVEAGGVEPSGDLGVALSGFAALVEEPLLAPLSFFILCLARLCFAGLVVVVSAVASVLAPALAFGVFDLESTFALAAEPAAVGVCAWVSVLTDESAAYTLKEIAARLLRTTGRNLRILVSME
jgi:hypothetical protein